MKVCFYTLGCKVNQHETGALQELLCQNGYTICAPEEPADVYIINSCTVTASGDKRSLHWLKKARQENPQAVTVLTGCYPQAFPKEAATAPADIILGNTDRRQLPALIERFLQKRQPICTINEHTCAEPFEELPAPRLTGHTRTFLKIEDGCDRCCAYCIIPKARGHVRSRSEENILAEMSRLAEAGYREFVLTGINLSRYGTDTATDLAALIQRASEIPGVVRIRLGSIEPDLLPDDILVKLSQCPTLCPQFHLSLQSGCDSTLRRMNRQYTTQQYAAVLARLRELFDFPTITTDVIVGFPGETPEDFAASKAFVCSCRFLKVHVFSYSPRPGTVAAQMPEQIAESVKAARSRELSAAADAVRSEVIAAYAGSQDEILLELPDETGCFTGYTRRYIPIRLDAPHLHRGDLAKVRLGAMENGRCNVSLL